jgi:hypothetical protein
VVRFIAGKDWLYAAVPVRTTIDSQSGLEPLIGMLNGPSEVPPSLRPFLGNPEKGVRIRKFPVLSNSPRNLDDGDIELMFSAKVDPVVGSYRDADTFPDGILNEGSIFGTLSSYA